MLIKLGDSIIKIDDSIIKTMEQWGSIMKKKDIFFPRKVELTVSASLQIGLQEPILSRWSNLTSYALFFYSRLEIDDLKMLDKMQLKLKEMQIMIKF